MRQGRTVTLSSCLLLASIYACQDFVSPGHAFLWPGSRQLDFSAGPVVTVTPGNMGGWAFTNDQTNTACTTTTLCALVTGPTSMPSGSGSAELAIQASTDGIAIARAGYTGVRLDQLTELSYSTYRQSADAGNNLAIALQLNVDYDLSDADSSYQGRLVYEPYRAAPGGVPQGTWQRWDTRAGKWWGTRATVKKNGVSVTNSCVQASPCTWAQVLGLFPNLGIHKVYGAVVLKAGSGWAAFRGNVDALSIGIAGITTTFDFETLIPVPATAPDSIGTALWDSLTQPSNLILNGPGGKFIRNLLSVKFNPTATLADRQYAIALVNGTVVGGFRLGNPEHFYYVRIPYNAAGDSVDGPVLRATHALEALTSIESATIVALDFIRLQYRAPVDGAGYTTWKLSRDSASGPNWGQIAVNAPFAWGCSTGVPLGQAPIPIAIVDQGFHNVPDLQGNIGSIHEFAQAGDTAQHGTAVAGIIGAVGGNGIGITGMLWQAQMNLSDLGLFVFGLSGAQRWAYNTELAVKGGARIVNLSWAISDSSYKDPSRPGSSRDSAIVKNWKTLMRPVLEASRDIATGKLKTLFVVGAGNSHLFSNNDAYWGGWGAIKKDLPQYANNMIIVGAASSNRPGVLEYDEASDAGSLVDIVAPGVSITSLGKNGTIVVNGTSFATPFITGIAGMLMSFDATLSPDSVKQLILLGAKVHARDVFDVTDPSHPKPFPDAYESLKLAARRVGAPLCGNRVHSTANGDVLAERVGSPDEKLFTSIDGQPYTDLLNVLHGGKRIQIGDYLEFAWNPSSRTWASTPLAGTYHQDAGGAFLSWYDGTDHDGHTYAIVNGGLSAGGSLFNVDLYPNDAVGIRRTLTPSPLFAYSELIGDVCTHWLATNVGQCSESEKTASGWREQVGMIPAFAPQGNFVLLGVNRRWHEQIVDSPSGSVPCTWPPLYDPGYCATYLPARDSSVSVELWLADTSSASRPWTRLTIDASVFTRSGLNVSWLAIDETGTEMVWELGKDVSVGSTFTCTGRVIEYRALPGHATVPAGVLLRPPVILPDGCGRKFGPATFAPYRAGKGATQSTVRRQQSASLRPKR